MPERNPSRYQTMRGAFLEPKLNRAINGRFLVAWPRAVKGHAAAEPAITWMNFRRCMRPSPSSRPRDDANQNIAVWRATINVRFGSKADICGAKRHVRFIPESDIDCVFRHVGQGPIADIGTSTTVQGVKLPRAAK